MAAVSARGLYKVFGPRPEEAVRRLQQGEPVADVRADGATPAVVDVDLEVQPGEISVVMGLSGSGKSTLIRMLNGLLEPTAGSVHVGDVELTGLDEDGLRRLRQERLSMVFQHFALLPHRTVLDNAAYALEIRGVERAERRRRGAEALEMVGLGDRAGNRPSELSGGMQQRVGLARALASGTDVMLMDEAFSALDPLIRREMQDQLVELQRSLGRTVVFITHDLNEAMRIGDRVAVMREGRVVQSGTPTEILRAPADDYIASFLADVDRSRVFTAEDVMAPPRPVDGELHRMPRAGLRSPLADLLQPAATGGGSVAVTDDAGEVVGVVTAASMLSALGTGSDEPSTGAPTTPEEALRG
ncbi:betaine/proline/choline family ABC transporter ATP-binding protein [Pseudokineococcus sp. 5B2Z-1]|uniref:quaternary amine ABC transporter ATP-binding protein n=1 Tax=Pseudokineococcus sp. 5B2Z-1 TaxID=3132744 RepID=UPI003097EDBA